MKSLLFSLIIFICIQSIYSQPKKIKWGKVPDEDMKMTVFSPDVNASAVILYQSVELNFEVWLNRLRMFTTRTVRIKILKPEGIQAAIANFSYLDKDRYELLTMMEANTFELADNQKVIKSKLSEKEFSTTDATSRKINIQLAFPNLKPGMIVEYRYQIASFNYANIEPFLIQQNYPVRLSDFTIIVPDFISYKINANNPDMIQSKEIEEHLFHFKSPTSGIYYINLSFNGKRMSFYSENVPAIEYTPFACEADLNRSKINIELAETKFPAPNYISSFSSTVEQSIKVLTKPLFLSSIMNYEALGEKESDFQLYPGGFFIYRTHDWFYVSEKLLKNEDFGQRLIKFVKHKELLDSLFAGLKNNPTEKLISIYQYVSQNIKWNKQYDMFSDRELTQVVNSKQGSSGEINLLLMYLFKNAGFETNPILVSTFKHGTVDTTLASIRQFNHVIASVKIDDKLFLFDATSPYRMAGMLDDKYSGSFGFMVKKDAPGWIWIENNGLSTLKKELKLKINANQLDTIAAKIEANGNFAMQLKDEFDLYKNVSCLNLNLLGTKENQEVNLPKEQSFPILIYQKSVKEISIETSDSMLIFPLQLLEDFKSPFIYPDRSVPLDFGYPNRKIFTLIFQFPSDYIISNFPQELSLALPDQSITYQFIPKKSEHYFEIELTITFEKQIINASNYPNVKRIFELMEQKSNEAIVLKKKKD